MSERVQLTSRCPHCEEPVVLYSVSAEPYDCGRCGKPHLEITFGGWCRRCETELEEKHRV